jgi:hypothetical protein
MSELFAYICTRSTNDPYIPPATPNVTILARDVSDGFAALAGGYYRVGQIAFFPIQRSVDSHLLCDGREVARIAYPELYAFLGDTQGTPVDPLKFLLPSYIGAAAFTPAATADTETESGGTVSTPPPSGGTDLPGVYGDHDSGGRSYRPGEVIP